MSIPGFVTHYGDSGPAAASGVEVVPQGPWWKDMVAAVSTTGWLAQHLGFYATGCCNESKIKSCCRVHHDWGEGWGPSCDYSFYSDKKKKYMVGVNGYRAKNCVERYCGKKYCPSWNPVGWF